MRKLLCIFLLTALLLSTLAACNAPDAAPDNVGNDISADTTAAPIETTTAEPDDTAAPVETTVVADDTTASAQNIKCVITCPDHIDVSGIKVDIYKWIGGGFYMNPDVREGIRKYQPHINFDQYKPKYELKQSTSVDQNSEFCFDMSDMPDGGYIRFDLDTLPDGYGIRKADRDMEAAAGFDFIENRDGFYVSSDSTMPIEFILEPIASASITFNMAYNGFNFFPDVMNREGKYLYADITLINGRFDDNFIDIMINGGELTYTVTLQSGTFSQEVSYTRQINDYWGAVWEIRAEYLYYNNYITKEQYDNMVDAAPYIYDARKQPLADSLASADEIKRVGIRMGRVIVEGNEQLLAFSATDENNCYIVIDSSYVRDDVTLLGTSPVVKYSTDYELIINLDNVYTDETGAPFTVCRFYVYDPAVGYYRAVSDPVEEGPGVYLMEVLVGVWSPLLAEWYPERAPELPPRQPNTVYPESYVYYFTVIF